MLHYGTDPNTTTSEAAVDGISVVNTTSGETVEAGEQFFMGQAEPEASVQGYEVTEEGELVLLGETVADEYGRFILLTEEELDAGEHTIVLTVGDSPDEITDISSTLTLNVVEYVKKPQYLGLGLQDGSMVNESRPTLSLKSAGNYMVVVAWRSTIYSQTLIADAEDQVIDARPVENLELGDHTVTWYAQDLETGAKSTPTQISFEVTNTAFISGEGGSSPWVIILGSVAVLASLSALALFYRNRRMKA